ncbi:MAG: preprotein translocase subunit TatC [Planctomycetes bacterium]|nr:preprotein translocase subunit TatC [Planctomycetota bacterium]
MPPLDDPSVRAQYEQQLPRMSFGDHLDELRTRLIRSLLAIAVAILAVMPFKHSVTGIVIEPYRIQWRMGFVDWIAQLEAKEQAGALTGEHADKLGAEWLGFCREYRAQILDGTFPYPYVIEERTGYPVPYNLVAVNGLEDVFAYMMAAFLFALVAAAPVVVWQAWAFVAAGLYPKEKALFYRYFPFMIFLLGSGVAFGYSLVLPFSLGFLIRLMDPSQVGPMLSIGQYFTLLFALTCAMGLVFQLPLVMVALQRVGLVTHRAFVKNWRITILVIFIAAAVFTPPEPVSMLLMAAPMVLLYGLGLLLTRLWRRHEAKLVEVAP